VNLSDFLRPALIVVPLEAETVEGAARVLRDTLVASGAVTDGDKLRRRMNEERPEDLVAMGDRAFLLHYRTDAAPTLCVALGTSLDPICRGLGEAERQCARVILLVVAPPRFAARYLQVVGAFARFLSSAERVDRVLAQPTAEAVIALPELREYELPQQLTVRELMSDRLEVTRPDVRLRDAARDMARARIGALPVVDDDGQLLGMLTERELVSDLLGTYLRREILGSLTRTPNLSGKELRRTVRDVMTRQVLCVSPDQPLAEAASLMVNKDLGHVPVVRDGRLVGLLTRGDIVRKLIGS
jgi:CBS domain-containing protein/mannitol/fructose-specific phosphotransferase system IIA component (Ntr-type)